MRSQPTQNNPHRSVNSVLRGMSVDALRNLRKSLSGDYLNEIEKELKQRNVD